MENIDYLKKQLSIMINLFETKRFSELIKKGIVLKKKFPDQAIFYNLTALAYNALNRGADAKKILIEILEKQPNNTVVLNNLGLASVQCGR